MKNYIFLTYSISNIGGSQIYIRNKYIYLEREGWDVYIYSYQNGTILINELSKFKKNIINELEYPINYYSKKMQAKVVDRIINNINRNCDITIIESNSIGLATWGEFIAKRIKCKNFVYLVSETFKLDSFTFKFLEFKHQRKELAGIQENSLLNMFGTYKRIKRDESYHLKAYCTNVVEDVEAEMPDFLNKADFTIGSIGRLEKPFLFPILNEVKNFILDYPQLTFNILLIGGAPDDSLHEKKIMNLFLGVTNVRLHITGYLYPIPEILLKFTDVFISSAGSAMISYRYGIPTISIDAIYHKPIGILGYSTQNNIYQNKDVNQNYSLNELLDQILFQNVIPKTNNYSINQQDFIPHIDFLKNSAMELEYYSIELLGHPKSLFKKFVLSYLGYDFYSSLKKINIRLKKALNI